MSGFFLWNSNEGSLQRTEVGEQPLTVGAVAPCAVVVEDESVGPIHAAIEREQSGFRLRRLTRVRPLTLNGRPVEDQRLGHADTVGLGGWEGRSVCEVPVASRMLRLVMTRGEREIRVDLAVASAITVVGRLEGDVLVDDPGISSRHFEIENFGPGLRFVRDLGSTNGTELNGAPLAQTRTPFAEGDVLTIGRVKIEIRDGGKTPEHVASVVQRTVIFVEDEALA